MVRHNVLIVALFAVLFNPALFLKAATPNINKVERKISLPAKKSSSDSDAPIASINEIKKEIEILSKDIAEEKKLSMELWVDHSRKAVDWWLQFLQVFFGVFGAIVSLGGLAIVLMGFIILTRQKDESEKILNEMKVSKEKLLSEADAFKKNPKKTKSDKVRNRIKEVEIEDTLKNKNLPSDTKLLALALQAQERQDWSSAASHWKSLMALSPENGTLHYFIGYCLHMQAESESDSDATKLLELACKEYAAAVKYKQGDYKAHFSWGDALYDQAKKKQGSEADKLFLESYEKYAEGVKYKSDDYETYFNWASALSDQAKTKQGSEADKLFLESYEKFAEAKKYKLDDHEIYFNWATALADQAETKQGSEADKLFLESYEKYAEAKKYKPDDHEIYLNWGTSLADQAETKQGGEADKLFLESYKKFAEAVRYKSDYHKAYLSWANALSDQARTKQKSEADELFLESYAKYAEAVRYKPADNKTYDSWGHAVAEQAKIKQGREADTLFERARDIFLKAEEISAGSASYNLACISALRGKQDECRLWLEKCEKCGTLPECDDLRKDSDLEAIREINWFKELLARRCG
ncbi:MAG: hypothetical protein V4498_07440 [candidate division FCPU426 bacterium]